MSGNIIMANLKSLITDMRQKNWSITSFKFSYKQYKYVVLVRRFTPKFPKPVGKSPVGSDYKYAIANLYFCDINDESRRLEVNVDSYKLLLDAKKLREFFHIEYSNNLGDILKQFSKKLDESIPSAFKKPQENELPYVISSLSKSDSKDPDRIYLKNLKRNGKDKNGKQTYRTEFNSDKAKLLITDDIDLLAKVLADDTISFCFSKDKKDCTSLIDAFEKFNDR